MINILDKLILFYNFHNAQFTILLTSIVLLISSFILTLILTPLFIYLSKKMNFLDVPDNKRKLHQKSTPLLGGLAISFSFFIINYLYWGFGNNDLNALFYSSILIIITGLIDDKYWLPGWLRLIIHIVAIAILLLNRYTINLIRIEYLGSVLAVLWIVGVMNAFNCMDALDGLLSGLIFIYASAFMVISLYYGEYFVTILCAILIGNSLAFLIFNFNPAKIFLGDNGSMFFGLLISAIVLKGIGPKNITVPIVIIGIPIYDIIFVHYLRYLGGIKKIKDLLGSTGRDHLPHRLLKDGHSIRRTVVTIYFLTLLCVITSIIFLEHGVIQQLIILMFLGVSFSVVEARLIHKTNKKNNLEVNNDR